MSVLHTTLNKMKHSKIFRGTAYCKDDLKNPIDINVVDLLTSRAEGCILSIFNENSDIAERIAVNYGPFSGISYAYRVFIRNLADGIYALDNAFDNKCFSLIKVAPDSDKESMLLSSIWRETDKISLSNRYTFYGDISDILNEFKSRGYSFLEQSINEDEDYFEKRIERIKQHLKTHNINIDIY